MLLYVLQKLIERSGKMAQIINTLLTNPTLAVVIVAVALVLAKALKLAGQVIKWILLLGAAYFIVTVVLSGVI